jgi:hypothetical protein
MTSYLNNTLKDLEFTRVNRVGVNVSASLSKPVHGDIEVGSVLRDSACKSKSFGNIFSHTVLKETQTLV